MLLETDFALAVPVERAWPLLTDLERVAPAMPGVRVESVDEAGLHATMRVKVGPVTASYRATVTIESADEAARTVVLRAEGRETRGPGTVSATVHAAMRDDGGTTAVSLRTDLALTGRIAQLGGGVIGEVAERLLAQFAQRLEAELAEEGVDAAPSDAGVADLGAIAARAVLPRAALAAAIVALLALLVARGRR